MSDLVAAQSLTPKRDRFKGIISGCKSDVGFFCRGVWWRFLWMIRLGTPYSKFMCRKGWYRKFADGRCMYCGAIDHQASVKKKRGS